MIGATGTPRAFALVLAVTAGSALVLRRHMPLAVLVTTLAATVAIVALGDDPSGATVLIALYTTAALCELRVSLVALTATAATAATLSALTRGRARPRGLRHGGCDHRCWPKCRHLGARRLCADAAPVRARAPGACGLRRTRARAARARMCSRSVSRRRLPSDSARRAGGARASHTRAPPSSPVTSCDQALAAATP
jgi:hypothetical protein